MKSVAVGAAAVIAGGVALASAMAVSIGVIQLVDRYPRDASDSVSAVTGATLLLGWWLFAVIVASLVLRAAAGKLNVRTDGAMLVAAALTVIVIVPALAYTNAVTDCMTEVKILPGPGCWAN